MNEENLIEYYNKFNEDKRLNSRHGKVEYIVSMKYIDEILKDMDNPKIIDIGAGCGKYSIALANKGYDVTALELVKHNLKVIEKNSNKVKTVLGNAINLSMFKDNSFDLVILFGPMYHLIDEESKIKALMEAKRIVKKDGVIMVAYCMNDYAIIRHGFMDKNILNEIKNNKLDKNFKVTPSSTDLYSYLTIDDINNLNSKCGLKRIKIITPDGPSNYMRPYLNKLNDEEFNLYIEYIKKISDRQDMIGASAHTVDIIKK